MIKVSERSTAGIKNKETFKDACYDWNQWKKRLANFRVCVCIVYFLGWNSKLNMYMWSLTQILFDLFIYLFFSIYFFLHFLKSSFLANDFFFFLTNTNSHRGSDLTWKVAQAIQCWTEVHVGNVFIGAEVAENECTKGTLSEKWKGNEAYRWRIKSDAMLYAVHGIKIKSHHLLRHLRTPRSAFY